MMICAKIHACIPKGSLLLINPFAMESSSTERATGNVGEAYNDSNSNPYAAAMESLAAVARHQATGTPSDRNADDDAFEDAANNPPASSSDDKADSTSPASAPVHDERESQHPVTANADGKNSTPLDDNSQGTAMQAQDTQGNLQTVHRRSSINTKIPVSTSAFKHDSKQTKDTHKAPKDAIKDDTKSSSKITHFMELRSRKESTASVSSENGKK